MQDSRSNKDRRVWSHDILPELELYLAMSGLSRCTFGRRYFNDANFIDRMRGGVRLKSITLVRLAAVRAKAERGELRPPENPHPAADYLPRMHAAREALGLCEHVFARHYLGDGTFFARARRIKNFKPETAEMLERVLAELAAGGVQPMTMAQNEKEHDHGN